MDGHATTSRPAPLRPRLRPSRSRRLGATPGGPPRMIGGTRPRPRSQSRSRSPNPLGVAHGKAGRRGSRTPWRGRPSAARNPRCRALCPGSGRTRRRRSRPPRRRRDPNAGRPPARRGILGATTEGERRGNPVQVRDGPAAVRGDAPAPNCHWPAGREGGEGGRPESEDLPLAGHSEPLAEGGFVRKAFITLAALIALAALLVPSALGASVSVRVEGRTLSIFGSLETRFEAGANAMQALDLASRRGEFYYHVTTTSFGPYVDQIGRHPAGGTNGWVFKVDGAAPTGGPPTLYLTPTSRNCFRVVSENDQGTDRAAAGALLHVDGRRVRTRAGRACVGKHTGAVRATLAGAVRSNALR